MYISEEEIVVSLPVSRDFEQSHVLFKHLDL